MRAVVFDGKEKVLVKEFPDPELTGPDSAILQVEQTSICGSDLHFYWEEFGGAAGIRPGHEFIGTVIETGADVESVRKGERVMAVPLFGCGKCRGCTSGKPTHCAQGWQTFGVSQELAGAQAEAVAIPVADHVLRVIPDGMTDDQAVLMTDVLPTGFMAARNAEVRAGDTVVVIGIGPIGLGALWAAGVMGAGRVIAVDLQADRLARAEALGAIPINPTNGPMVDQVMAMTNGRGADRVIEAIGLDQTIADALMAARAGGYVSIVGVSPNFALPICAPLVGPRNLTIRFGTADVPLMWESLFPLFEAGRLEIGDVLSHRLPLSQAEVGYDLFANKKDGCFKVVFDPRD